MVLSETTANIFPLQSHYENREDIYMQTPACDDTHGQSFKTTMHSLTKKLTIFFFEIFEFL